MIFSELQGMNIRYYLEEMMSKYCVRDRTYVDEEYYCEGCTVCKIGDK